jgi:hypothetical protein
MISHPLEDVQPGTLLARSANPVLGPHAYEAVQHALEGLTEGGVKLREGPPGGRGAPLAENVQQVLPLLEVSSADDARRRYARSGSVAKRISCSAVPNKAFQRSTGGFRLSWTMAYFSAIGVGSRRKS